MNTKTPQGGWPISDLARNVNDPEVVAELQRLYALYEAALVANHVETLTRMFGLHRRPCASGYPKTYMALRKSRRFARADLRPTSRAPFCAWTSSPSGATAGALRWSSNVPSMAVLFSADRARFGYAFPKAGELRQLTSPCCPKQLPRIHSSA